MKIAYITAGAANMFCGSCLRDNTLVAALIGQGHDALLIPTYTPIRTDEEDVSQKRVFFGGINVYLQQKSSFFRHTPWLFDRLLDFPGLLRWVSRFAMRTQAQELGELTVSMLQGEHGHQKKEIDKLVYWLAGEVRPEIINITNVLLSGMVHELKAQLRVPILGCLQGDDLFLESLTEPYKTQALELVRAHCRELDGFIAPSAYYADFMAEYLHIPRPRIDVVYPGLNLQGHGVGEKKVPIDSFTIGYLARICPEKGLHILVEAFRLLRQQPGTSHCRLRVAGWLGESEKPFFEDIKEKIQDAGLTDFFDHVEVPDHVAKVRFLQSLDVLSVPTTYREPKGLYVLEALANGVPVVQPRHGSFPEWIEASGGGMLVNPADPADLAQGLHQLLDQPELRRSLGQKGKHSIQDRFHAAAMAANTLAVYRKYLS